MPNLTLRDVPADLHRWLKQQAGAHRRSLNQEVILQLDALMGRSGGASDANERLSRIRAAAERAAGLPVVDARTEAEILGLGFDGLPG
jgi:hypothetical protein